VRDSGTAPASFSYESGYSLYAHAPGRAMEQSRQKAYADWIAAHVAHAPRRIIDVGCGNGSLLTALAAVWPTAELFGCDPSGEAVRHVPGGIHAWQGTANSIDRAVDADLVISVNVIEHTRDPVRFVRDLQRAASEDAIFVLVCPNGAKPDVELLFADHLWSLAPAHLARISARAGLRPIDASLAPQALGEFHMAVCGRGEAEPSRPSLDARALNDARTAFLERWRALDDRLVARLPPSVVCFGIGEAAALVKTYARQSWQRVHSCTADQIDVVTFDSRPVVSLDDISSSETLLLAVRAADQETVAARLRSRFPRLVTWYDLVRE
jgi:SAM-dependent methyltransferase